MKLIVDSFVVRSQDVSCRRSITRAVVCLTGFVLIGKVLGASWEAELEDGRQISVDPTTNRPVIQSDRNTGTPLWDGVHRLSDGTVITVRSGVMVPNEDVMTLRRGEIPEAEPRAFSAACNDLVLQACGLSEECAAAEPCNLAKQLRELASKQSPQESDQHEWAETRCQQGLTDPQMFPVCTATQAVMTAPCEKLVEWVCGKAQRCAQSEPCQLANQLHNLEQQAEAEGNQKHAQNTRQQCQETLGRHAFFPPCR